MFSKELELQRPGAGMFQQSAPTGRAQMESTYHCQVFCPPFSSHFCLKEWIRKSDPFSVNLYLKYLQGVKKDADWKTIVGVCSRQLAL